MTYYMCSRNICRRDIDKNIDIDMGIDTAGNTIKDYSFTERNAKQFSDPGSRSSLGQCFPILKW